MAVGVQLRDRRSDTTYEVRAEHVVVCADGLRTPQVLFASGIRPPALGHYLNEHFQMANFLMLSDEFDPQQFERDPENVMSIITPFSDARPLQMGVIPLANSAFKMSMGGGPGTEDLSTSRLAVTACYAAKDIQYSDAVEFSETEVDFYGMPRMHIRYSRTDADLAVIEQMRQVSVAVADRLGTAAEGPGAGRRRLLPALPGHRPDGSRRRRDVSLQSRPRGVGGREPLPRRQRGHPHSHGLEPDADHRRLGLARRHPPRRAPGREAGRGFSHHLTSTADRRQVVGTRRAGPWKGGAVVAHPLWRPYAPTANADRQAQRVGQRQVPPGPLQAHQERWALDYAELEALIGSALGERQLSIHHVGSTAVPGLTAKPVIDIDLTVPDVADEDNYLPHLGRTGFTLIFRDSLGEDAHRQLTFAAPNANLHVWSPGAVEPQRHLLFLRWLSDHPDDRDRYAAAKLEAAGAGRGRRYNDLKSAVVYDIYERAFLADPTYDHDPQPRPSLSPTEGSVSDRR